MPHVRVYDFLVRAGELPLDGYEVSLPESLENNIQIHVGPCTEPSQYFPNQKHITILRIIEPTQTLSLCCEIGDLAFTEKILVEWRTGHSDIKNMDQETFVRTWSLRQPKEVSHWNEVVWRKRVLWDGWIALEWDYKPKH